jgi:histidine triad (HIT) family protein
MVWTLSTGAPAEAGKAANRRASLTLSKEFAMTTLFARIVQGEIPAAIVYQDDLVTAFRDIHPQAPTHILIVPNKVIPTVNDLTADDEQVAGRMLRVAAQLAAQEGIDESGYRLIINCNHDGGQEIFHLHMHLLGGRRLGPMLSRAAG